MTATRERGVSRASKTSGTGGKGKGTGSTQAMQSLPSREEISQAAYQRWLRRGGAHGGDLEDWLEAEKELNPASPENK